MSHIDTTATLTKEERREQKRQDRKAIRQLRAAGASASAIPPPAERFQTVADWPQQPAALDVFGEKLRAQLGERGYTVVAHHPASALGNVWLAFTHSHRVPVIAAVRDASSGPQGAEFGGFAATLIGARHPAVLTPRDAFAVDGIGHVFVFDAPPEGRILRLRELIRWVGREFKEEEVGRVFASVAAGLQFLQRRGELPDHARIDADSVLVFPDLTVRFIHPLIAQHGDKAGPHHAHRKLNKRLKKVDKKAAKGDEDAAAERTELFERFIVADLSVLLYELMTRKVSHSSRHKMVHDAEKMREALRYSPELTQLLVDLLEAGRTPKNDLVTIDGIVRQPVLQRFLDMLVTDAPTTGNPTLQGAALAEFMRGFDQHRMSTASRPTATAGAASATIQPRESHDSERARMVRGEGQGLARLRSAPLKKKNGIRIDIPQGHERPRNLGLLRQRDAERKRMVRGEGHRLTGFRAFALKKKNGVRLDLPLNQSRPAAALSQRRASSRRQVVGDGDQHNSTDRVDHTQQWDAERKRMVHGDGQKLAGLRKVPLKKKNGVRLDIPLGQRPRNRELLRQRKALRSRMARGAGHGLAPLFDAPVEKRLSARIDIPFERSSLRDEAQHDGVARLPLRDEANPEPLVPFVNERKLTVESSTSTKGSSGPADVQHQQHAAPALSDTGASNASGIHKDTHWVQKGSTWVKAPKPVGAAATFNDLLGRETSG